MFEETLAIDIAEGMRKAGKRPSVRTIRQALAVTGNSGSLRRVAEVLRDWRRDQGLSEFEADTGVPPEFQTRLDGLTAMLWEAAKTRASSAWHEERVRLSRERDEARRDLDGVSIRLAEIEEQLRSAKSEAERQSQRADKAEAAERRRAKEYWDRVLRAVGTLLAQQKRPMAPNEILGLLSGDLHREANYHAEALDLGTLTEKLRVRGVHRRYVEPADDGSGRWQHRSDGKAAPPEQAA